MRFAFKHKWRSALDATLQEATWQLSSLTNALAHCREDCCWRQHCANKVLTCLVQHAPQLQQLVQDQGNVTLVFVCASTAAASIAWVLQVTFGMTLWLFALSRAKSRGFSTSPKQTDVGLLPPRQMIRDAQGPADQVAEELGEPATEGYPSEHVVGEM